MRRTVALLSALLAVTLVATGTGAAAKPVARSNGTLLVIGDSITARYGDAVGPSRGWWSIVAESIGMTPIVSAESGSGFLMHGATRPDGTHGTRCSGSDFTQRLTVVTSVKPDAIIVEGGRNDFKVCGKGKRHTATRAETTAAIAEYMRNLSTLTRSLRIPAANIYVASPWGSAHGREAHVIRPLVKKYAERYGFTWLATGTLATKYTVDGTHPNTAGNVELARRVYTWSNLDTRSW